MLAACMAFGALLCSLGIFFFLLFQSPDRFLRGSKTSCLAFAQVSGSCLHEGAFASVWFCCASSVLLRFPPLPLHDTVFAGHLSNVCFSPSFLFVIWQGDPIPEDIYEILGGSSVRSISDLQRALRIDSVGKSPLHRTLLYFFLTL